MKEVQGPKDLYVLVADQDMVQTMEALLNRGEGLGIQPISYAIATPSLSTSTEIRDVELALLSTCATESTNTGTHW